MFNLLQLVCGDYCRGGDAVGQRYSRVGEGARSDQTAELWTLFLSQRVSGSEGVRVEDGTRIDYWQKHLQVDFGRSKPHVHDCSYHRMLIIEQNDACPYCRVSYLPESARNDASAADAAAMLRASGGNAEDFETSLAAVMEHLQERWGAAAVSGRGSSQRPGEANSGMYS